MLKCQQLLAFYHLLAGQISCSAELSITSGPDKDKKLFTFAGNQDALYEHKSHVIPLFDTSTVHPFYNTT